MRDMSAMGCHRALNAMDLRAAATRRLRVAAGIKNERMRADTKASAKRLLEGLRDLRQIIGQDGYRLP